jgi:ribonuclease E
MLIDASHPEETRVVVQRGNRIDEFDYESASRKQLRGNIYLAKVTRVEPSLQAAFVEYGGNRHGFLAFSEIHPDYYQIPVADRQALLEEEARFAESSEDEESGNGERRGGGGGRRGRRRRGGNKARSAENGETIAEEASAESASGDEAGEDGAELADQAEDAETGADESAPEEAAAVEASGNGEDSEDGIEDVERDEEQSHVEQVGGGGSTDTLEDMREQRRSFRPRRQYKIQEVIKRRQILLVQVVKEERGNKGAALTTYLSLAGRYCVLMPNTARGGGISRKITNSADRRRLKELASDLDVPEGMGVILRTAGASRTMPEIKRDFEYLMRVWEQVRETTLQSVAPTLVHEEGSLIKRSLRDLFGKEVDEAIVSGEDGFREARDFMKMLMPSQVKAIKAHREPQPLFTRYGVESQLDAMFQNTVTLRSGGYIVINPTEALVSIDVNSGRSTREHNIEDTALKTNLEAAEEVARQLRLRDLAGLIVIDFIDMEEHRNNRTVEKKLKDCLKNDRARIQVGRISPFGLLEMSRQRMRTGVLESSTTPCPHCGGSGFLRATSSVALLILRAIEDSLLKSAQFHLTVKTRTEVALYILNQKRLTLRGIEERFGVTVTIAADDSLHGTNYYTLERGEPAPEGGLRAIQAPVEAIEEDEILDGADDALEADVEEAEGETEARDGEREGEREGGRRGRRRRRRGRGRDDRQNGEARVQSDEQESEAAQSGEQDEGGDDAAEGDRQASGEGELDGGRRRRRGRRGGRRNRRDGEPMSGEAMTGDAMNGEAVTAETAEADVMAGEPMAAVADTAAPESVAAPMAPAEAAPVEEAEPAPKKRGRSRKAAAEPAAEPVPELTAEAAAEVPADKPKRGRGRKAAAVEEAPAAGAASEPEAAQPLTATEPVVTAEPAAPMAPPPAPVVEPEVEDPNRPKRTGWWSRAKKAIGG